MVNKFWNQVARAHQPSMKILDEDSDSWVVMEKHVDRRLVAAVFDSEQEANDFAKVAAAKHTDLRYHVEHHSA